jgi:hypothetical protein
MNRPRFADGDVTAWLSELDDGALAFVAETVRGEIRRRAEASGDPEALVDAAFGRGFTPGGEARDPEVVDGVLFCYGSKLDRGSRASGNHACRFVVVDDDWSWGHRDVIIDRVRALTGRLAGVHTVTLLPATEGFRVAVVTSKAQRGLHTRVRTDLFECRGGRLVRVPHAAVAIPDTHRA